MSDARIKINSYKVARRKLLLIERFTLGPVAECFINTPIIYTESTRSVLVS